MGTHQELTATITDVGTDWVYKTITGPPKYQIHRARIVKLNGTGTQFALSVGQTSQTQDIKLRYDLSALNPEPDSIETDNHIMIFTKERNSNTGQGTTYLAVKANIGTDSTIYIALDIETVL